MQNRSIFPYRRHGPKKRVKHGPNHKSPGPRKGLPNSARDLLPMLQPATKALAQVLAGRTGASGQLGHARSMLAQAERMIAERAHNRLAPAEREEFFEQLARLKLTLADADVEAEVQAVEEDAPRIQLPPVAQERLKEMALALAAPQRPGRPPSSGGPAQAAETVGEMVARQAAAQLAKPTEPARLEGSPQEDVPQPAEPVGRSAAGGMGDRLVLPKAGADQVAQAVAFGGIARRRSRAATRGAMASAIAAEEPAPASTPVPTHAEGVASDTNPSAALAAEPIRARARIKVGMRPLLGAQPAYDEDAGPETVTTQETGAGPARPAARLKAISEDDEVDAESENRAAAENGAADKAAPAKTTRRTRKPKRQGLPAGWVIDDEGFVVPGVD